MAVELIAVVALLLTGIATVSACGLRGWAVVPLGFLVGQSVMMSVGFVLVALPTPSSPAAVWVGAAVVSVASWVWGRRAGWAVAPSWRIAAGGTMLALALAASVRSLHLFKWHADSFTLLNVSAVVARGEVSQVANSYLLIKRPFGYAILHSPATLVGEYALTALAPITSLSLLALLWWFYAEARRRAPVATPVAIGVAVLAVVVATNRYVFHSFYLNTHLALAALATVAAGLAWLVVRGSRWEPRRLAVVIAVLMPGAVLLRPDGALLVGIAIFGLWLAPTVPWRVKAVPALTLVASMAAWNIYVTVTQISAGGSLVAAAPQVLIGGLFFAALVLVRTRVYGRFARFAPVSIEIGAWLAFAGAFVLRPTLIGDSVGAALTNFFGNGAYWGTGMAVIAALTVGGLVVYRSDTVAVLRLPVTTFIPVAFVLAVARDGDYRVGPYDSLARMGIHLVPLAALLLLALASENRWRFGGGDGAPPLGPPVKMRSLPRALEDQWGRMTAAVGMKDRRTSPAALGGSALGVIAIAGALQFPAIEATADDLTEALHSYPSSDIRTTALIDRDNERSRYSVYVAVGELAPRSDFRVCGLSGSTLSTAVRRLYGFGDARSVTADECDVAADLAPVVAANVVASGPGGERGAPWLIAFADSAPSAPDDPEALLPRLLRDEAWGSVAGPAREFVVVEWPVTRSGSMFDYQLLIIDSSLLASEADSGGR